jgi:hypothetical protein
LFFFILSAEPYLVIAPKIVQQCHYFTAQSMILSILARGKSSLGQYLFKSVKSMRIYHFPFFFWTITTFASHWG